MPPQTIWLVLIAVLGIFVYMFFRFHPWIYGAAAILGILHDALVMLSFDAVFRVEIDAATIAAILTILGYSINDTIVNFDRARENLTLMRGESLRNILDTSVTQTLTRTFITSGATLLTVIALFVLTSGSIKNFALNMIVGIVEGTYSTFLSAFFVIEWTRWREGKRKASELKKYGFGGAEKPLETAVDGEPAEEESATDAEPAAFVPGQLAVETAGGGQPVATSASSAPSAEGPRPAAPVNAGFLGQSGSRKHKKHRRRHH